MLFVDSSALVKRYVYESETPIVFDAMANDVDWVTSAITKIETRATIARRMTPDEGRIARRNLAADQPLVREISIDATCDDAAHLAESHRLRSLDAIQLAAAVRAGGPELTMLTFDDELASAARELGIPVIP